MKYSLKKVIQTYGVKNAIKRRAYFTLVDSVSTLVSICDRISRRAMNFVDKKVERLK